MKRIYELMHGKRKVARVDTQGHCKIYYVSFLPYGLCLEDTRDIQDVDTLVNNITNFYYWCSSRMLTLDRQYAKEILNSIGVAQPVTDRERAAIALSYRCVSLTDIFWVREAGEKVSFEEINLYENHLDNAFVDVALRGRQMTVEKHSFARDISTNGSFPKAWVRRDGQFWLYKDGGERAVEDELLASKVCQCFRCDQVVYQEGTYDGRRVSVSRLMTTPEQSIVSREAFEVWARNRDRDPLEWILKLDSYSFYMMNLLDYLIGNTDRHWGNWGLLVDNRTNRPVRLHALMDFNQAFHAYDTIEGADCLTMGMGAGVLSQKEAALEAAGKAGLNQCGEIRREWFGEREQDWRMFQTRLNIVKME